MPVGMMKIPIGPHAKLARFHDDPVGLKDYVGNVVTAANENAHLDDLYIDVGKDHAMAVIKDLDDDVDVKAVSRILGADGYWKNVPVEKAADAIERERQIIETLEAGSA